MLEDIDLSNIQDENARQLIVRLMNLIEAVTSDLREAQAEIQRLRDENNRLKGEQGKPKIKASTPKPPRVDYSSEQERRKPKLINGSRRRRIAAGSGTTIQDVNALLKDFEKMRKMMKKMMKGAGRRGPKGKVPKGGFPGMPGF